jgi:very-short-patch-repair endonuclease
MTEQERKLWYLFMKDYPIRFQRQKVIDRFIVDFYCASAKLIIELDGSHHFKDHAVAYDNERTAVLEGFGLHVIRFTNSEVDWHFKTVCEKINSEIMQRVTPSICLADSRQKTPPVTS